MKLKQLSDKCLHPTQIKYRQWIKDNKKKFKNLYSFNKDKYNGDNK